MVLQRLGESIGPMPSKSSKLPKYVYVQHIKGRTYYRFRRKGGGAVRLPGHPDGADFHAAYARLLTEAPVDIGRYTQGSVAHTIHLYRQSAKFSEKASETQRDYGRYLDRLDRAVGERPMASLDSTFMHLMADKLRATPGAANHMVSVVRTLCKFSIRRKIIKEDPTTGIERLKGGDGYLRWPEEALVAFRATASPMMCLALDLGVYTGQRLSDAIRLAWSNYDGARIRIRQKKTGTGVSIPVHEDLKAILDALPRKGLMVLTSRSGLAFHSRVFSRDFRSARIAAGLPDGYSYHGLRHTAASVLAEVGCTAPEIMSITGHKSLKQVQHYIRQASQELQADRAIARLPTRNSANQPAKHGAK